MAITRAQAKLLKKQLLKRLTEQHATTTRVVRALFGVYLRKRAARGAHQLPRPDPIAFIEDAKLRSTCSPPDPRWTAADAPTPNPLLARKLGFYLGIPGMAAPRKLY
jgi:hypothetical protein